MRSMSAREAKNRFGELLMEAQRAPVTIEKNGKPVAVVVSYEDHRQDEQARLEWLQAAVAEGLADSEAGRVRDLDEALLAGSCARGRAGLDQGG